jgi:hypothetical protein
MINPNKAGVAPEFDIKKTKKVTCEKCGGIAFRQTYLLRLVSPILSENGKGGLAPLGSFICENPSCNHVNPEFILEGIRGEYTKSTLLG